MGGTPAHQRSTARSPAATLAASAVSGVGKFERSTSLLSCGTQRGQCSIAGHPDFRVRLSPQREQLTYLTPTGSLRQSVFMAGLASGQPSDDGQGARLTFRVKR
jgi:hypothetical protein